MPNKLVKKKLILIYGANGVGKTITARNIATNFSGLHISMDLFSSMFRGKIWHSRKSNKNKMTLIIGLLNSAINETSYNLFVIEGVLIYTFMFRELENWCANNNIIFHPVKLIGSEEEAQLRIISRNRHKINWNELLPDFYDTYTYKNSMVIDINDKTSTLIEKAITEDYLLSKNKLIGIECFSLGMLKPDCLKRKLENEAFRRIMASGFEIVIQKKIILKESEVSYLYSHCEDKIFFDSTKQFLTSSECLVFIVKSTKKDAIKKMNSVVGFTKPSKAKVGTLRELGKNIQCNIAHSSDSMESFIKESNYFFSKYELIQAGLNMAYYNFKKL